LKLECDELLSQTLRFHLQPAAALHLGLCILTFFVKFSFLICWTIICSYVWAVVGLLHLAPRSFTLLLVLV